MSTLYKERIIKLLIETKREGIDKLINYMNHNGFFIAPCSSNHHLAVEGGLAEHSLNVYDIASRLLCVLSHPRISNKSVTITSLLHDLGKIGQYGKSGYIPNMLKGKATKSNPEPEPYQSDKKPFIKNPDLLYVDHEIRSIQIASQFIKLTEEESYAILNHNGMYSNLKYSYSGKETPLSMVIHWADMWASRVVEENGIELDLPFVSVREVE